MTAWKRWDPRYTKALQFATGVASVVALTGGALLFLQAKALEAEAQAFVEQSLGESARWAAEAVHNEVAAWSRQARALERRELRASQERSAVVADAPAVAAAQGKVGVEWTTFEADPEWIALSVWKEASGPEGQGFSFVRAGVNSASASRPSGLADRLGRLSSGLTEALRRGVEGNSAVLGDWAFDPKGALVLVLPQAVQQGASREVLVGYLSMGTAQKWFRAEGLVRVLLVDGLGRTLADPTIKSLVNGPTAQRNPLVQVASEPDHLKLKQLQTRYVDLEGREHFGAYHRVEEGKLLVLASIPVEEAFAGVRNSLNRSVGVFVILTLLSFVLAGMAELGVLFRFQRRRRSPGVEREEPEPSMGEAVESAPHGSGTPMMAPVTALSVSLESVHDLVERQSLEEVTEGVNTLFVIAQRLSKEFQAKWLPTGGASFCIFWDYRPERVEDRLVPVFASLELRKTIAALNEARKVDGHRPVRVVAALHGASELLATLGPAGVERRYQPVGSIYAALAGLRQVALRLEIDLVVTRDAVAGLEDLLLTEELGEHRVAASAGLFGVMALRGYRSENGESIRVETPYSGSVESARRIAQVTHGVAESERWLVNNGSKILGPLSPAELAQALFTQEIDFDSECWREGTGQSSQIRTSGIFSGSDDPDARLWILEGETLHGPVTPGFVSIALDSGAISLESYLCEESTIRGWKTIREWKGLPKQADVPPETVSAEVPESSATAIPPPPPPGLLRRKKAA